MGDILFIILILVLTFGGPLLKGMAKGIAKNVAPDSQPQPKPLSELKRLFEEVNEEMVEANDKQNAPRQKQSAGTKKTARAAARKQGLQDSYFTYENMSDDSTQPSTEAVKDTMNTVPEATDADNIDFDLRKAFIYQAILKNEYI